MSISRSPRSYSAVPVGQVEPEELRDRRRLGRDQPCVRTLREDAVAGHVVAVAVGVQHEQRERAPPGGDAPLHEGVDGGPEVRAGGAGVEQQRLLRPDEQIQERLLVVGAPGLADHDESRVVLVRPEGWPVHAVRLQDRPRRGDHAALERGRRRERRRIGGDRVRGEGENEGDGQHGVLLSA